MKKRPLNRVTIDRISVCLLPILLSLLLTACAADPSPYAKTGKTDSTTAESAGSDNAESEDTETENAHNSEAIDASGFGSTDEAPEDPAEQAAAISEKYDVRILLGDQVPLVYKDYTAAHLNDPQKTADALEKLDSTLSIFPPGFFSSVKEDYCDSISICLAQDLQALNNENHIESANAFTTVQDDTVWLVLNAARPLERGILVHELTHVIDYRLLGMQQLREEEWNQLNPPSFSYYNSYLDENGMDLRLSASQELTALSEEDPERIWFCDAYSKTFAMEDRARLMESLLEKNEIADKLFSSPHIRTKLRFYFYILRQAFENAGWPEETVWEAELHRAAP